MATAATTTSVHQLESIVQKRLHIKWVDTKRLVQEALHNCEIVRLDSKGNTINTIIPLHRQDEIIEEACEIYADLSKDEQDRMKIKDTTAPSDSSNHTDQQQVNEPEWKRKARIQAERREAEWLTQQVVQQNQDQIHTILKEKQTIIPPEEIPLTTIKSIRRTTNDQNQEQSPPATTETTPIIRVRTTTCYCTIQ